MITPTYEEAGILHPSKALFRFSILVFVASLTFGSYFAYDIVGAIAPTLVEELGTSRGTLGTFYTMYHIAAILFVLIGGFLIDKVGTRKASISFSLLVLGGVV
ncbi:MAG: MFS transporter, partial [Candidatus Aminicenantes bacterium]|nr:MFS transporter [Candidatus Aminicenantes bacterium]